MEYHRGICVTCAYFTRHFHNEKSKVPVLLNYLLILLLMHYSQQQNLRNFPSLFDVARERPLSGSPTVNTCGAEGRSAFCKSSTLAESVDSDCRQDFCIQDCPYRSSLPPETNLMYATGYGACVNSDTVNVRPGSRPGDYAAVFYSGSQCYITPINIPNLGPEGSMTLSFWVWQGPNNLGTVVEKWSSSRQTGFKLLVSTGMMVFHYRTTAGLRQLQISEVFPLNTWTFVAFQVYQTTLSYFINGESVNYAARGTFQLAGSIVDDVGNVRVGQDHDGADQFLGRLQELKFFNFTLSNREIEQLYSGSLPVLFLQSECRCPPTHPRIKPINTKFCIPNGVPYNTIDEVLRLNNFSHPIGYLNDGNSTSFWVSSFLDDVTLTVDLQDQYEIFYVIMQFYSPQPKMVTIERRLSANGPWQTWQYYAEDCNLAFGLTNNGPLIESTSLNCIQFGTNGLLVPYSKGNITFSVLASEPVARPGHNDFYNTPQLFAFVKAYQVRVRMQDHYYVTHARHKYYGIYDFIITGRCNCNGHAELCDTSKNPYNCSCYPESFTHGAKCDQCLPLYNNKPFRAGDQVKPYNCKQCECYSHADSCEYNATLDPFPAEHDRGGGGVCINCRDNTTGQRCDSCRPLYYREVGKSLYAMDVCSPCNCFTPGVAGTDMDCAKEGGQCKCKVNVEGRQCDRCKVGYFNLLQANPQGCEPCSCSAPGSKDGDPACHQTLGQCNCKKNVRNMNCDTCQYGFFNLTALNSDGCNPCNCNPAGSTSPYCNPDTGACQCKTNIIGRQCNQCADGYYNFTAGCVPCNCNTQGTVFSTTCDKATGQCICKRNVEGKACTQCKDGYFGLGSIEITGCSRCDCNEAGTEPNSTICEKISGNCTCKSLTQGRSCNECVPYAFNMTVGNPTGCQLCNCDASGTKDASVTEAARLPCDRSGYCSCLPQRQGRQCDSCQNGYYLNTTLGGGCLSCTCPGTSNLCDRITGACACTEGKIGKFCDQCPPGTYKDFSNNNICQKCNCEMAGSVNDTCHATTGKCFCKQLVTGDKCNLCTDGSSNLQESNPVGCSKAPSQQPPPKAEFLSPTTLRIYWEPPDNPNGIIIKYTLNRNNTAVASIDPTVREYNDTNLLPYTEYQYSIEAWNSMGSTRSPSVKYRTLAGAPTGEMVLTVTDVQARSAVLSWNQPTSPNGILNYYEVTSTTSNNPIPFSHTNTTSRSTQLMNLQPFTIYTFKVSACTSGGCLTSEGATAETRSAVPEGQASPTITPISETSLYITWNPPEFSNGIIIFYELWMRGIVGANGQADPPVRIYHPSGKYIPRPTLSPNENEVPPPATNYTVRDLKPFTEYEFQVLSENSIGKAASPWTRSRTLQAVPLSMTTPAVSAVSSTTLQIAWRPPDVLQARGIIVQYNIYHYKASDIANDPYAPPFQWQLRGSVNGTIYFALVDGFLPYTNNTFMVEACNAVGCVNSTSSSGYTDIAGPDQMGRLFVEGYNSSVTRVKWQPPAQPNAAEVNYELVRTALAFNSPPPKVDNKRGIRFPGGGYYRFAANTIPQGVSFHGFEFSFKAVPSVNQGLILYAASVSQEEVIFIQLKYGRLYVVFDSQSNENVCMQGVTNGTSLLVNRWHHVTVDNKDEQVLVCVDGDTLDYGSHSIVWEALLTSVHPLVPGLDSQANCVTLTTTTNDEGLPHVTGKWQRVQITREGTAVTVKITNEENLEFQGMQIGNCTDKIVVGDNTGVYIGGIPTGKINYRPNPIDERKKLVTDNFVGCIADFKIMTQLYPTPEWKILNFDSAEFRSDAMPQWEGCPQNLNENLVHFIGTGYILAKDTTSDVFRIGGIFRTELANGLLVFLPSYELNYWFVQLQNGTLVSQMSNGASTLRDEYVPPASAPLCNGYIQAFTITRLGARVTITINDTEVYNNMGERGDRSFSNLALKAPTNIGGIKPNATADILIKARNLKDVIMPSFGGCLHQQLDLGRGFVLKLREQAEYSNMRLDGCPAYYPAPQECKAGLQSIVYSGQGNETYDSGLLPSTEYVYRVKAYNNKGYTYSTWFSGQTNAGAPVGVRGPSNVTVLSGYTIFATWLVTSELAYEITGPLTWYKLLAYNQDNSSMPVVFGNFSAVNNGTAPATNGNLTGLTPATNYLVKFGACTTGGCTESQEGRRVRTFEEAPEDVAPPKAVETGGSYIVLSWEPPAKSNGNITGYFLYVENVEAYSGALLSYNVTGLQVYTGYRFKVRACTLAGCTSSPVVNHLTMQLPPSFVDAPRLLVLGSRRVRVDWSLPDQLNGALTGYLIRASTVISDVGSVVYNSTEMYLFYIVENLTPGTTYYFRVSACTGGGCRISQASTTKTEESAPEGIALPNVTSPSPSELLITWSVPDSPNGIILEYRLFHNSLMVYNDSSHRQYFIGNLLPWSLHEFRVQACTARGCGSSDIVQARTQEAPPEGVIGMEMLVEGPRTVKVKWTAPTVANGLLYNDVYFKGIFYKDPENWDYNTVETTKSKYRNTSYTGDWVTIENLVPYTTYQVYINISNTKGYIISNTLPAVMPPGSPDGVKPPVANSPTPKSIQLNWGAVGRANSDQKPVFQLQFRDAAVNALIQDLFTTPTTATSYTKLNLTPYTQYSFRLVASNSYGETRSEWVSVTTKQDKPSGVKAPAITNVGSRSLDLSWALPTEANGEITQVIIMQNDVQKTMVASNTTKLTISDLTPFNEYIYRITFCTDAGCTTSPDTLKVRTLKAPPEGLKAPVLLSETPTSMFITWTAPLLPNGDILTYTIERRQVGIDGLDTVITQPASMNMTYTDRAAVLSPYTKYEYRVIAASAAGNGYSPWAAETTRSSTPGGVKPPFIVVFNSTTLDVSWEPPIKANGRLEYYIIKLPEPRFTIRNTSQTSLTVYNLTPYTEYQASLIACSDGGCTESIPTIVTTNPALPSGQQAPKATPHSQSYISVLWLPPLRANGPNIRYELLRAMLRQPLVSSTSGFSSWSQIYAGTGTYYEDRGLTIFTTYKYKVTVYNDFGQITSDPSEEVTTFGGTPSKPATVYATPINHTAAQVKWDTPSVFDLQGGVSQYELLVTSIYDNKTLKYGAQVTQTNVGDLIPSTRYEFRVKLTVHGGATITSLPAFATTMDGAPEGLAAPQLLTLNDTTLRVIWTAPERPNGRVIGYYVFVNTQKYDTRLTIPGSYVLYNLIPYTVYTIQMEVCTEFACSRSDTILGTTAEALPSGIYPPTTNILSSAAIRISWVPPDDPNGIVLRYDLMRRDRLPCSQAPPPTNIPPAGQCVYLQCGILESFCGNQCYSGPKTCCDGVLYDNNPNYECCGQSYVPSRNNPEDVCCGGQFYTRLVNHQCCGGRYVPVNKGEVCCPDPMQDRVDVGLGDMCCGSVPYYASGAQVCCSGKLMDKYGQQCCGGSLVSADMVCCGNATAGKAYSEDPRKLCCGSAYTPADTSICCVDRLGHAKVHTYGSVAEKTRANEKCCGVERVSSQLTCCNTKSYTPITQSCADISEMQYECGQGTICPLSSGTRSYCDRCDFNRTLQRCGSYIPTVTQTPAVPGDPSGYCWTPATRIFSGLNFTYNDMGLQAYTQYEYAVAVINGAGSTLSDYIRAITLPSLPEQVNPPKATIDSSRLDTIFLTWEPPNRTNGEIVQYVLLRDGVEIFRDPSRRQYTDNNAIQPYKTYTYMLQVCTSQGCVNSDSVNVATLESKPNEVTPPVVTSLSPTALHVSWKEPNKPNGLITVYKLVQITIGISTNFPNTERQYNITGLKSYTQYEILLTACTEVGCTNSSSVKQFTMEEIPEEMPDPHLVIVNSTSMEVHWQAPLKPHGIISTYIVYLHPETSSQQSVLYTATADVFKYMDMNLTPGSWYSYSVEAKNAAGGVTSQQVGLTMPMSTPQGIGLPRVTVLGPRNMSVEWDPPTDTPADQIDQYRVVLNAGKASEVNEGVGLSNFSIIDMLKPFTYYEVRIQACLKNVPAGCGTGPGIRKRTNEAPPEKQPPPKLIAQGSTVIELKWDEPEEPNGIITQYRILRRLKSQGGQGLLINVLSGNTLSFVNAGPELQPFTDYEYKITAVNAEGETDSSWAAVKTLEAVPQGINLPVVSNIGAYSMTVLWVAPSKSNGVIKYYRIEWRQELDDPTLQRPSMIVTLGPSVRSTTISGLQPYMKHQVRVIVLNGAGQLNSPWVSFTTAQASPADLQMFTIEKISSGRSVILRWDPPRKPNGVVMNYLIYERGNINAIYQGLIRVFEYRRLEPYTAYAVQLEVCTIGGCSRTAMQTFTTAEVPPSNQPVPTFGSVNATHVVLRWGKPISSNGKILRYEVLRRMQSLRSKRDVNPAIVYTTEDTDADAYEYIDSNLQPYSKYDYKIRATNAQGSTESSWQGVETMQAAPAGVLAPVVTHTDKYDTLKVSWSEPTQPNGIINMYQLQRNSSVPWSFTPDMNKEYTDTGLGPFTTYSYTVKACTAVANGCTVSPPTVITTRESAPYFVTPPTLTVLGPTAIRANWTQPQITNGKILEYRLKIDNITHYSGAMMEYTATALTPYKGYNFVLSACTMGGCSDSAAILGRPMEAAPSGMRAPTLRVTSSTSVEISWQAPDNPNGVITSYEVRRDTVLIDTTNAMQFTDYGVSPGREYTYRVTAFNSQGNVTSPSATALTYSSSPSGLKPPVLEALSSTSVRATWEAPLLPNGAIHNYTLYMNFDIVYSDRGLSTVVEGLQHWTTYSFRVQACTSSGCAISEAASIRTLQAPPMGLQPPRLTAYANIKGAHDGVLAEWQQPQKPNGIITKFELYRRNATGLPPDVTGPRVLIYTGLEESYVDRDPTLQPFTQYEYMVRAYNDKGAGDSIWESVLTKEGPPEGVVPPRIKSSTSTTLTLELSDPVKPNGRIEMFNVYMDDILVSKSRSTLVVLGEDSPLDPFKEYKLYLEACTVGGCGRSPTITAKTLSQPPQGMASPILANITQTSIDVSWNEPAQLNGVNIQYELMYREGCPPPYGLPAGRVQIVCSVGDWVSKVRGKVFRATVDRLRPYTTYDFQVHVSNEAGKMEDPPVSSTHTDKAAPEYRVEQPPEVRPSGNILVVDWSKSFYINGDVTQFMLFVDRIEEYAGLSTTYNIFRQSLYKTYTLQVRLVTDQGSAQSPVFIFDPSSPDIITSPTPTAAAGAVSSEPFYQQVWFIVVIAIACLVILFIGLACCLRTTRQRVPYVRERMPLDPRHKVPLEFDHYGSSNESFDLPVGQMKLQRGPPSVASQSVMHTPSLAHVGYINPAFSHITHSGSLIDLNLDERLDKMSHKSSRWGDEDDWDTGLPPDSGLHSLAYGEEYDSASDRPISVLKEHTMFADTHL